MLNPAAIRLVNIVSQPVLATASSNLHAVTEKSGVLLFEGVVDCLRIVGSHN